jgi:hypothetical protein
MVIEVLLGCALVLGAVSWREDRRRLATRLLDDIRTRALPVELALWWQDRGGGKASERAAATRRSVHRIQTLARPLGLPDDVSYGIQLATALPPGMLAENDVALPTPTRRALAFRHARWDGSGIPSDARGSAIPIEAQILALLDWLEVHDGSPAHAVTATLVAEGGGRFSKELVALAAERLAELRLSGFAEAASRFRVTDGALVVVLPEGLDGVDLARREDILRAVDAKVRAMVRPTDRVYCTEQDVVVWLGGTNAEGAMAALRRFDPQLKSLPVPAIEVGTLRCATAVALADTDATSFTALLAVARDRGRRKLEAKAG